MPERASDGRVLYLLGFVRARDTRLLFEASAQHPVAPGLPPLVAAVEAGEVAALVERVPLDEYGPDVLQRNVENIAWVSAQAQRHHLILAAVARVVPVAPAKLGTVFLEPGRLRSLVAERAGELLPFLDRVDGMEEWGIRFLADASAVESAADRAQPALAELADRISRTEPGMAYLLRKRQQGLRQDEVRRLVAELAEILIREVEGKVGEVAELPLREVPPVLGDESNDRSANRSTLLRLAVLVSRAARDRFELDLGDLAEAHQDVGLRIELGGPWPPYSFCPRLDVTQPASEEASP